MDFKYYQIIDLPQSEEERRAVFAFNAGRDILVKDRNHPNCMRQGFIHGEKLEKDGFYFAYTSVEKEFVRFADLEMLLIGPTSSPQDFVSTGIIKI